MLSKHLNQDVKRNNMSKKWYTSKGMWLGIAVTAGSVLDLIVVFLEDGDVSERAALMLAIGVTQIVIRTVTKTSVTL